MSRSWARRLVVNRLQAFLSKLGLFSPDALKIYRTRRRFYSVADWNCHGRLWAAVKYARRCETHSETRTALCNAVKHTVKHSAKRCNLQWFCVLSRSKGCCIQKSPSFFFPQARNVVNYRVSCCVSLCVSLRFTAPCAFHCILQRCASGMLTAKVVAAGRNQP